MFQKKSRQDKSKFRLLVKLGFQSKENAEIAKKSVLPELNAAHVKRSKTLISIKNKELSIEIMAADKAAMRAAANGCLNSIELAKSVTED